MPVDTHQSYEDFMDLLMRRRSIRYFSEKKTVDAETVQKILAAAHLAPSVENTQPWRFHVIQDPELKTKVMECSCYGNFVAGASVFVVVTCDKASKSHQTSAPIWNPKEMEYSCVAAMQNAMLAAATMGIGSCWVSLHHGPTHNILKLKDHQMVIGGMMLGYLREGEKEPSGEHDRRPLKDVIVMR